MFVLMDLEWVENKIHHFSPTQIAAMRVDAQWNCLDRFYSRICPRDGSFHTWNHVAYTGATPTVFLHAKGIHRVLTELQVWLREDGILCFWYQDSENMLKSIFRLVKRTPVTQRIVILKDYVVPFLSAQKKRSGNPYALCRDSGIPADGPRHQSENDVLAMQKALCAVHYPAELLYGEAPRAEGRDSNAVTASASAPVPDALGAVVPPSSVHPGRSWARYITTAARQPAAVPASSAAPLPASGTVQRRKKPPCGAPQNFRQASPTEP